MNQLSLLGKTAVITGATGGIGQAIALRFAHEGANVVLVGRSSSKLERAFARVQQVKPWTSIQQQQQPQQPAAHSTACFDVGSSQGWESLVSTHPKIDILVNCAGQSQQSLLLRTSEAAIEDLLSSNLRSTIWGCRAVGKRMMAARAGGCIINVASLLAQRAVAGTSVYAAAKAGQLGLTTALAQEFGHYGIRVNAIVPGYIDTDMTHAIPQKPELTKRIPLQRFGTPDEVADAAAFLAKNQYAHNCILNLDGGLSAV